MQEPLHFHIRTLHRPQTNRDKASDKSTSDKESAKRNRRDAARPTSSSSSPISSTTAASSPMEDTPPVTDTQQPAQTMLYVAVDGSETAAQLKQRVLSHIFSTASITPPGPSTQPSAVTHSASLYYRGCLLRDAELLVQQIEERGDVYITAVLTDRPSQPTQSTISTASLSSSPSASTSSPTSATSSSTPASSSSSSSLPSTTSHSSRRQPAPPEQILTDLNRLITADILNPLLDMGFTRQRAIKALIQNLLNPELAIAWLLEHTDDADIDDPLTPHQLHTIARAFHLIPSPDIDQCIRSGRCTYTVTAERYAAQQYYQCRTCELVGGRGCCVSCARVCHGGHVVEGPIPSESFFCDCGAGVGGVVCRALTGGGGSGGEVGSAGGGGGDGAASGAGGDGSTSEEDGMEIEGVKRREEEARRIKAEEEERSRFITRSSPLANSTTTISDLNPLDFLNTLVPHFTYPPLPRHPLVAHGSLATVHSLLLSSDWPATQQWVAAHAEEVVSAFERHLLEGGGEVVEGLVAMLCWVVEWLPLWDERVLSSVGRLVGVSVGWEWRLPLLINTFASPYSRPLTALLHIDQLQSVADTAATTASSSTLHSSTPRLLYAQLLFNLSLHCIHRIHPLPPSLLPALLTLLTSPGSDAASADEREWVHRLVVQSLLLCVVERGRDVRVGCMTQGLCSGLEPIVARKGESASAFAALLLRVVRL